jgi:hypothetical protein
MPVSSSQRERSIRLRKKHATCASASSLEEKAALSATRVFVPSLSLEAVITRKRSSVSRLFVEAIPAAALVVDVVVVVVVVVISPVLVVVVSVVVVDTLAGRGDIEPTAVLRAFVSAEPACVFCARALSCVLAFLTKLEPRL